nr:putative ribonuclease H-like domain-containing protein [Tanacetum cinerariifolium]
MPNHDTGRILPSESQTNTTVFPLAITDSSATDYDSADESSVCSTPLPPLGKLGGAEPVSGPKDIKSILKSNFKNGSLKNVSINEPSSTLVKINKEASASKINSAHARKLNHVEARLVEFKEHEIKFYEKIRGLERDVKIRDNKIEYLKNELEQVKKEKESLDNKLTSFENASKDLDNLLKSQRSDKNKEGLRCLLEFVDDTVIDYSRPTPSIDALKCNKSKLQSSKFSVSEHGESSGSIMSKPMIKFAKEADCPRVIKTNKTENVRKSTVKYAETYRNISKGPNVRGNQPSEEPWPKDNYTHKSMIPRAVLLKPGTTPIVNNIDDKGYWDSGCSRHITDNISYLSEYEPYDGGYFSFRNGGGKITSKGIITTNSDYGGATQDRKSTTGGCWILGRRLISWQCKKQTIVATSTTEAEYVAAASGCGQVLWIQNQMLDYG